MQTVKEKIGNMSSSAKEHVSTGKAKVEEKLEKAAATTEDEKKLAHERKKAKEARAKMELHQDKVKHLEEKLTPKQPQYLHGYGYDLDHDPALQPEQTTAPPYHLTAHPPPHRHS
ncbi:late embryogenesis abundant protein 18-like [Hibiscus syriacus]|nr:late embryogenesis abundant protein 18-like [Hibiscus syriacus]